MAAPAGNNNKVKGKPWVSALNRALALAGAQMKQDPDGGYTPKSNALKAIASQVVDAAINGERWAIEEISNRLDGKPAQQTILTGADDGPIQVEAMTEQQIHERIRELAGDLITTQLLTSDSEATEPVGPGDPRTVN